MDELIASVSQKTGLSADQSKAAAQAVLDYIMAKLPGPLGEQVKNAVMGGGSGLPDAAKGLGGLFGQK
jgi:hypothetical protein